MSRIHVAGCPVDIVDRATLNDELLRVIFAKQQTQVLGVNAAIVVDSNNDRSYHGMLEATQWVPVDGFWVSVAARILGWHGVTTVGIERLVYELLPQLAETSGSVYLLGAREEVVQNAAETIKSRYPGIQVAGTRNGYFTEKDEEEILVDINTADPDVILVGMTSPMKEQWMLKYKNRLTARVTIGVGGLLDVIAGKVPSAPIWIKNMGMEWFFRFYHDPKRLFRRYAVGNMHFIWLVLKDLLTRPRRRAARASSLGSKHWPERLTADRHLAADRQLEKDE